MFADIGERVEISHSKAFQPSDLRQRCSAGGQVARPADKGPVYL